MNNALELDIKKPKLADYQRAFLYNDKRFTVTEASTKTGKTFSHIFWLYEYAHGYQDGNKILEIKEGMEFWWVAPVYAQAKIAFNRLWRKLAKTGLYKANLSDLTITTPYKSIISFKSAQNPDNLYGEDVYAAVFDEFTRAKQEAWFALRSTLTATKAPCKFIGNYKGNSNWGHQLGLKANDANTEYQYFKVTAWDAVRAGILDEDEILQAQKDLPPFMFKALYLAEGDIDEARLIEDDAIDDLQTNEHALPGNKYISADIALHGSDKFVIYVWDGWRIIHVESFSKLDSKEVEKKIKALANKYHVRQSHIVYDADGIGAYLKGYMRNAVSFHNNGTPVKVKKDKQDYRNLKSQCYFLLAKKINDGGIYFDCNIGNYWDELREELEYVKNRAHGTDGKLEVLRKKEIHEYIGRSPDYADAMMMRMIFDIKPRRKTNTAVL